MEYLNLPTNLFRSPEFIGADPSQRGTWTALMGWCASQENGGRIVGCRGWKDRMWQQLLGVTADEVLGDSTLWEWDGDDLIVAHYPVEQERAMHLKREGNARGGRATTDAKAASARTNGALGGRPRKPVTGNPSQTQAETEAPSQVEPNVKEGNVMEGKEREGERANAPRPSPPLSPAAMKPIDRVRSELATVFPDAPRHMTGTEQHELFGSLELLDELTPEDWLACRCWVTCPERVRGRKLWPRDRAEFVANAGQAIEAIRPWWKSGGGRTWWNQKQATPAKTPAIAPAPTPPVETSEDGPSPLQIWNDLKQDVA